MKRIIPTLILIALIASALITLPAAQASPPDDQCPSPFSSDGHHKWYQYSKVDATCTKAGKIHYVCSYCDKDYFDPIKAKGHKWGSWTVLIQATCTKTGKRSHTCTVCGEKATETIKKTDHKWGAWTIVELATDFSSGTREHACKNCSATKTASYDPDGTLRRGNKGDAVKRLQQALNAAGYDCGKADGTFGKNTEKAIKKLEADHGIKQDGIAWPGVQAWLDQSSEPKNPAETENLPKNDSNYGWTEPDNSQVQSDCCIISYAGSDDETLSIVFCSEHKATVELIETMLVQYAGDIVRQEIVWQSATLLWEQAMNKEYDELLAKADSSQKEAIKTEREQFTAQFDTYKAALLFNYADELSKAYELIADEMEYHAVELCYISNSWINSGESSIDTGALSPLKNHYLSELDSITNMRYRSAEAEEQALIVAERVSFGGWLSAREAMLRQLYADNDAAVSELMAQAIYQRVLKLTAE